jgi:hypothetical protein
LIQLENNHMTNEDQVRSLVKGTTVAKAVEVLERLKKLAALKIASDNEDFNACDYSGGNYDDAFDIGEWCGKVQAARDLLDELGIEY